MLNYYQVLEVEDFSNEQDVKKAYRNKCKEYHPDRINHLGPKLVTLARNEMAVINKAYDILSTPDRRIKYDAWLHKASEKNSLISCRHCGVHFDRTRYPNPMGICPICIQHKSDMEAAPSPQDEIVVPAEDLLRNCFIVIFHFVSSSTLQKFVPTIYMLVNGETIIASGAPSALEVTIDSKNLFDLIHSDGDIIKHNWNAKLGFGKITFSKSHPVDASHELWKFCNDLFGEPVLEYCHLEINNEDFKPYEHILNQSVLVLAAEVSPWNASKLFARHRRNLYAAVNDPETTRPDPFITLMAGQKCAEGVNPDDLENNSHLLQSSLLATKERLSAEKRKLNAWNNQVSDMLKELGEMRKQIGALKSRNSELENMKEALHAKLQMKEDVIDQREKEIALMNEKLIIARDEATDNCKSAQTMSAELDHLRNMVKAIVPLRSRIARLEDENIRLSDECARNNNADDEISKLKKRLEDIEDRDTIVEDLEKLLSRMETQYDRMTTSNQMLANMRDYMESLGKQNEDFKNQNTRMRNLGESFEGLLTAVAKSRKNNLMEQVVGYVEEIKLLVNTAVEQVVPGQPVIADSNNDVVEDNEDDIITQTDQEVDEKPVPPIAETKSPSKARKAKPSPRRKTPPRTRRK